MRQYTQTSVKVLKLVQTNPDFFLLKMELPKQTAPSEAIRHQRDKQITFVCRADIQLFNLSVGY